VGTVDYSDKWGDSIYSEYSPTYPYKVFTTFTKFFVKCNFKVSFP